MLLDPFAGQAMRGHKEQSRERGRAQQDKTCRPTHYDGRGWGLDGAQLMEELLASPVFNVVACALCLFPLPLAALTPW